MWKWIIHESGTVCFLLLINEFWTERIRPMKKRGLQRGWLRAERAICDIEIPETSLVCFIAGFSSLLTSALLLTLILLLPNSTDNSGKWTQIRLWPRVWLIICQSYICYKCEFTDDPGPYPHILYERNCFFICCKLGLRGETLVDTRPLISSHPIVDKGWYKLEKKI